MIRPLQRNFTIVCRTALGAGQKSNSAAERYQGSTVEGREASIRAEQSREVERYKSRAER